MPILNENKKIYLSLYFLTDLMVIMLKKTCTWYLTILQINVQLIYSIHPIQLRVCISNKPTRFWDNFIWESEHQQRISFRIGP